jgi:hypothetical protein
MDPTLTNVLICAPQHEAQIKKALPGLVERFSKYTGAEFENTKIVTDYACPPDRVHMFDRHGRRFDILIEEEKHG